MLTSNEITLRALKYQDENRIYKWANDPELKDLTGTIFPISELEHKNWIESRMTHQLDKTLIIETKDEVAIGLIGIKSVDLINSNGEIYIYIGESDYLGMGLGTKALDLFLDFNFNRLNIHKIYLHVFEFNVRAIKSYEKLGFIIEGNLQDNLFMNGKYHNTVIMAKLNPNHK